MQFDRRKTVVDSGIYETLDALLDGPFALCAIVTDADGQAVDYRFLRVSPGFEDATGLAGPRAAPPSSSSPASNASWLDLYGRVALDRAPQRFRDGSALTGRELEVLRRPARPAGHFVIALRDVAAPRRARARSARRPSTTPSASSRSSATA